MLYLAIVAMWAAVLIPMWWRQREQVQPVRSVDRFHGAMQTLAGARSGRPVSHLTPAQRRRRTFLGLVGSLLVVAVTVLLGWLPGAVVVLPLGLLAGFAVLARAQVLREQARRGDLGVVGTREGLAAMQRAVMRPAPVRAVRRSLQEPVEVPAADDNPHVRVVERGWAPTATTLPTYVTAPAATRVPRVIDLTTPGAWTGEAMVRQAGEVRQAHDVRDDSVATVPEVAPAIEAPADAAAEDPMDPPAWARAAND